jgi:hypothetical protein
VNDKHPGILQAARFENNLSLPISNDIKRRWFRGGILYTEPLFKGTIEAFRLFQSFLSCSIGLSEGSQVESLLFAEAVDSFKAKNDAKAQFKRHIQRYTFQVSFF